MSLSKFEEEKENYSENFLSFTRVVSPIRGHCIQYIKSIQKTFGLSKSKLQLLGWLNH
jgi:hypothetical protein